MSVVGPRPPLPEEVAEYDEWAMQRLAVKPGLTGPWQVGGCSDVDFDDMVRLDLWPWKTRSSASRANAGVCLVKSDFRF